MRTSPSISLARRSRGIMAGAPSTTFRQFQAPRALPDSVPRLSGISGEGIIVGSVNIKAGGHVNPGFNGVGTLLVDGITINGSGASKTQFNMQGDATGFGRLFVTGFDKFHLAGEAIIN